MFTGIITHIGKIEDLQTNESKDLLVKISTSNITDRNLDIGCSIACNGACLTLIEKELIGDKHIFSFQASKETLDKTTLNNWKIKQLVNLEFAMKLGDELGGHMVSGHVDGCSKIINIQKVKDSHKFTFTTDKNFSKFISEKGSITLNGTSLTVNEIEEEGNFSVNLISHTIENTSFRLAKIGDAVNLEIDMIARYLDRLVGKRS